MNRSKKYNPTLYFSRRRIYMSVDGDSPVTLLDRIRQAVGYSNRREEEEDKEEDSEEYDYYDDYYENNEAFSLNSLWKKDTTTTTSRPRMQMIKHFGSSRTRQGHKLSPRRNTFKTRSYMQRPHQAIPYKKKKRRKRDIFN